VGGRAVSEERLYRPAWFLRFKVRLEDFGQAADSPQDGSKPYVSAKAKKLADAAVIEGQIAQAAAGGDRSRAAMIGLQATADRLRRDAAKLNQETSAGPKGKGDEFSVDFVTVPMDMDLEDKGFREADALTASFPFQDMPLHPLIVKECAVEAWAGTVKASDFATPENWHLRPISSNTSVLMFKGYVDVPEMVHDESSGVIHIKARSYISVLIDGKINPHAKVYRVGAPTKPIPRPADYGVGNIDLNNRTIIHNQDGSISTVFSMTFGPEEDGSWVLVPGVRFGLDRKMTEREAYSWYRSTGQYLGKFKTLQEADAYANSLHEDQALAYATASKGNDSSEEYITTYINRILALYPPTSGDTGGDPFRAYWYAADPTKEPKIGSKTLLRSLKTAASRNAAAGQSKTSDANAQPDPPNEAADAAGQGDAALGGTPAIPSKSVSEDGMSPWDLITQACELCGVLPMYKPSLPKGTGSTEGKIVDVSPADCLLISPPEAFLDDISSATQIAGGARDGFHREFAGVKSDVRFMVWGHNLSKMKLSRKMGKVRPSAVEVRSYNPDASDALRQMSSRFPRKGRTTKGTEKGGAKLDVVRTFVLQGIRDQHALDMAAASIYQQLCRPELTMEIETDELASYIDPAASQASGALVQMHNEAPDILKLTSGTPVHVTVAKKSTDETNLTICSLSEFYDLSANNIVELLTRQNDRWGAWRTDGSLDQAKIEETARKIQAAYRAAKLPTVYYCCGIHRHFSSGDEFFHATIELMNYMPSNEPSKMDVETKAINDDRKRKKTSKPARAAAATQVRSADVVDQATRAGIGGR
jgi:hypothetical protein